MANARAHFSSFTVLTLPEDVYTCPPFLGQGAFPRPSTRRMMLVQVSSLMCRQPETPEVGSRNPEVGSRIKDKHMLNGYQPSGRVWNYILNF